jgi:hypothetical protein
MSLLFVFACDSPKSKKEKTVLPLESNKQEIKVEGDRKESPKSEIENTGEMPKAMADIFALTELTAFNSGKLAALDIKGIEVVEEKLSTLKAVHVSIEHPEIPNMIRGVCSHETCKGHKNFKIFESDGSKVLRVLFDTDANQPGGNYTLTWLELEFNDNSRMSFWSDEEGFLDFMDLSSAGVEVAKKIRIQTSFLTLIGSSEDREPPSVMRFDIDKKEVKAGETLIFTVKLKSIDASGLDWSVVNFRKTDGKDIVFGKRDPDRIQGLNLIYEIVIPPQTTPGDYVLHQLTLADKAGNEFNDSGDFYIKVIP